MALAAATVWEVRTDGADTNGGGFVTGASGTDYSQQAAAQYALTNGVTQGTTVILTASAATDMVGNIVYVTGGTGAVVAAWYQITAASAGVSITVDRSTGLTAGTGVTLNIGGALVSVGILGSLALNGNIVFIKAGTFSISSASTNVSGGALSSTALVMVVGYSTTRTVTNTDTKPVLQFTVSTITFAATRWLFVNIEVDGNSQTSARLENSNGVYIRCTFRNFNTASGSGSYIACSLTTSSAAVYTGASAKFCEAFSNTATPYNVSAAVRCLSYSNTGASTDGFNLSTANSIAINCIAYANGRDGFGFGSPTRISQASNCHAEANSQYGFNLSTASAQVLINCSYFNNTSGGVNSTGNVFNLGAIPVTAGSVFVNSASGNFALNNTANQGALLRAAAFPATFPAGSTASYSDIGAAQHQDPAGGGLAANPLGGFIG